MRGMAILGAVLVLGCGEDPEPSGEGTTGGTTPTTSPSGSGSGPATSDPTTGTPTPSSSGTTSPSGTDNTGTDSGETSTETGTDGEPDGPDVDQSDPQLYEFELDPVELDPSVVDNIELQFAHLDTRVDPIGKLVFFLSGFTNTPSSWRNHGRQLAGHGFHVVEPHYANDWSCDGSPNCSENTRWEALTGEDTSPILNTSRADSAEGRVITMLLHLVDAHPGGDWGYYLNDDDTLRDEHVIIAGISHGASSTGLFATRRAFHRAVMHSGGWGATGDDPATPIDAFYGLTHVDDEQHAGHLGAWESAGMLGAPTVIEDGMPPYGDARQLVATTPNGYPHCSVCVSGDSPTDGDGLYLFDPAWRHMYGAPQL